MRDINKIIIHCSATHAEMDIDVETIRRWHVELNGWSDIGYHYVIKRDGTVQTGRPLSKIGAHCRGHNKNSIGICYVGGTLKDNTPSDTRTKEQKKALKALVKYLQKEYPNATIHGHNEFTDKKACPSFNVQTDL